MLADFQNFCTAGKHMAFATKPTRHYPPHLGHVPTLHYLGKLKMQIFCRYSAHMEENAFYRLYLCYSSTNFHIFSVENSEFFPY